MDSQQEKPGVPPDPDRPGFFGIPNGFRVWARVGPRFWGGLLGGLGLGLWAAKFLDDLGYWRERPLVGFFAIALVGIGLGIAISSVRRSLEREKLKS
jgi:hypothetical protein